MHDIASTTIQSQQEARPEIITEAELLRRLPVCKRTLHNWRIVGILPFIKAGKKRVLYHWPSVMGAMLRMQRERGCVNG